MFGSIVQFLDPAIRVGRDAQVIARLVAQLFCPLGRKLPAQLHGYGREAQRETRTAGTADVQPPSSIFTCKPLQWQGETYKYSGPLLVYMLSVSMNLRV